LLYLLLRHGRRPYLHT